MLIGETMKIEIHKTDYLTSCTFQLKKRYLEKYAMFDGI